MTRTILCVAVLTAAAFAQTVDNRDQQLQCETGGNSRSDRFTKCEIREKTVASVGRITVGPVGNGGIAVKGWTRNDVLVRARVETRADSDAEANALLPQIHTDVVLDQINATGPTSRDGRSSWTVSYEVFVPQTQDVKVTAHNGGILISDVRGRLEIETHNGGIQLKRVNGDVTASTTNGGVRVELAGAAWIGQKLDLQTKNGGVTIAAPANYSARIQAETVNGGVRSDFGPVPARTRPRSIDVTLGSGGAPVHVATKNGGITLTKL